MTIVLTFVLLWLNHSPFSLAIKCKLPLPKETFTTTPSHLKSCTITTLGWKVAQGVHCMLSCVLTCTWDGKREEVGTGIGAVKLPVLEADNISWIHYQCCCSSISCLSHSSSFQLSSIGSKPSCSTADSTVDPPNFIWTRWDFDLLKISYGELMRYEFPIAVDNATT